MPRSPQDPILQWVEQSLPRCFSGTGLDRLVALKGDASTRQFWRVFIRSDSGKAPPTAIAIDLGPDDLPLYARALGLVPKPPEESPWVNVHRLMEQLGVAVPAIYLAAPAERKLLVEDVGNLSLYEAVTGAPRLVPELYRMAIDELLKLHAGDVNRTGRQCMAFSIAYDQRLFGWEMEQFIEYGIPAVAPGADAAALRPDLERLAASLGALPRVLSHRDYHYQNLFIQNQGGQRRIRVIDFQDSLMAPAAQDLAVLLTTRDTGNFITPALEAELLDYYLDAAGKKLHAALDRREFLHSYRWCVLQHALKVIGRFVYLEQTGKQGYKVYLPAAMGQARRILKSADEFPALRGVFKA